MGLVDYSDSESDSEPVAQPAPAPTPAPAPAATASGKKPFQKIIDRSQPGKIRVSLPQASSGDASKTPDEDTNGPPPKRARVARGGGAFSGFNSFLPPPKNTGKPAAAASGSGSGKAAPRPGINLKTGAAPGFSRETDGEDGARETGRSGGDDAETATATKQPLIPAGQKPADEVKLVGKPLMFKPLSVSRKPGKKSTAKPVAVSKATTAPAPSPQTSETSKTKREAEAETTGGPPPPKKQKISLFSLPSDEPTTAAEEEPTPSSGVYEPMFGSTSDPDEFAAYDLQHATTTSLSSTNLPNPTPTPTSSTPSTLDAVAADMNLSATARRELFGRGGAPSASHRVVRFDTGAEYAHNEALRAAGAQQPAFNPLRGLAPGKHSLRQLVTQAQSHREALEDGFAQGKSHRGEAGARYGWR